MEKVDIQGDGVVADYGGHGITIGGGPTVPADNLLGYSPSCLFVHNDATTDATRIYVNRGTKAAANFDAVEIIVGGLVNDVAFVAGAVRLNVDADATELASTSNVFTVITALGFGDTLLSVSSTAFTLQNSQNIVVGTGAGTKIGTATTQKIGFYNVTPVVQPTALTAGLTTLTHTAPGTPDYAVQALTQTTPFGFVTADEGHTALSVLANIQAKVAEIETRLEALGLVAAN